MRRRLRTLLPAAALLLGLTGIASCPDRPGPERDAAAPAAAPKRVAIAFTADLLGYLEPCGCVKGQLGGIARTAGLVEALKQQHDGVLYLDAGDTLSDGAKVDPKMAGQARAKAGTLAKILTRLGVHTVPGPTDKALGPGVWAKDLGDRSLVAEGGVTGSHTFDVGGVQVGVVAVSDVGASGEAVANAVEAERAHLLGHPRVVVVLANVGLKTAMAAATHLTGTVDAVIAGHLDDPSQGDTDRAVVGGGVPVFRPMSQGRSLGILELRVPPGAPSAVTLVQGAAARSHDVKLLEDRIARMKRQITEATKGGNQDLAGVLTGKVHELQGRKAALVAAKTPWPAGKVAFTWRFEPVSGNLPQAKWAKAEIDAYDQHLGDLNLAWAKAHPQTCPAPAKGKAHYVGAEACAGCHRSEYVFWKHMRHADAWKTLVDDHKQYDLECVGCHVTGWQEPGGVCDLTKITKTVAPHLSPMKDVQCESCHGPASRHLAAQTVAQKKATIRLKVPAAVCVTCHRGEHSPNFDYDAYLKQIIGPGHGTAVGVPSKSKQ